MLSNNTSTILTACIGNLRVGNFSSSVLNSNVMGNMCYFAKEEAELQLYSLPLSRKMYIYSSFWSVGIRCHIFHALAIVALVEFICVQITSIKYIIIKQDFCYSKRQKELDITCCI